MRGYASVYKSLERTRIDEDQLRKVLTKQASSLGELAVAGYTIQALDHTPYPRESAPTVGDRGYVHGADGIVVGHQYSLLGRVMAPRTATLHETGAWIGVEDCERIPTDKTPVQVGAEQGMAVRGAIARLRDNSPETEKHIVTADSEYVTAEMLDQAHERTQLLIRLRGNRTLYRRPEPPPSSRRGPGRPRKRGPKFKLDDSRTWGKPDHLVNIDNEDGGWIEITVFKDLHFKSHPNLHGCIIRVCAYDATGNRKFARPLWLYWTGPSDMDWNTFWRVYLKRFCIEAVHQFAKNNLAWTAPRLGYTDREERWTWLVMLAYWQLLVAIPLATDAYMPWQKPLPPGRLPTPARIQRDYYRIFLIIGTPAYPPIPRGYSPGRPVGQRPMPRQRFNVVYKGHDTS